MIFQIFQIFQLRKVYWTSTFYNFILHFYMIFEMDIKLRRLLPMARCWSWRGSFWMLRHEVT